MFYFFFGVLWQILFHIFVLKLLISTVLHIASLIWQCQKSLKNKLIIGASLFCKVRNFLSNISSIICLEIIRLDWKP